jgi:hypothetical protein
MNDHKIFADPLKVEDVGDCYFYHTMEIPGYGLLRGDWDLRRGVDDYLGNVEFTGKRVLELVQRAVFSLSRWKSAAPR